jgi:hypothetical protein
MFYFPVRPCVPEALDHGWQEQISGDRHGLSLASHDRPPGRAFRYASGLAPFPLPFLASILYSAFLYTWLWHASISTLRGARGQPPGRHRS